MDPSSVPIAEVVIDINDVDVTEFKIGNEADWIVEWRKFSPVDDTIPHIECDVVTEPPSFIQRSRSGWYIDPDPLHTISRRLILPTVSLLIISLFVHAIEPGLVEQGIISQAVAGSISIGPLDYPRLLFFTFPIFLIPLLFRTIANFRDMARQAYINSNPYDVPVAEFSINRECSSVRVISTPHGLSLNRARIQVGVAVPERSTVLKSLSRTELGQPSPGMSTRLPEKRLAAGDEAGIGVGEATPMQSSSRRGVILEPMRIMESGEWTSDFDNGGILNSPNQWPGTIYSSLIAIHWEAILEFMDNNGDAIKWVTPILMPQSDEVTNIDDAPIRSGRAELSSY